MISSGFQFRQMFLKSLFHIKVFSLQDLSNLFQAKASLPIKEDGIRELSELAGVSARTLRYYDEIGLLKPLYVSQAGYRFYGEQEAAEQYPNGAV